ncbi:MAG: hypothetical protein IJI05_01410, partial [Erysipelotrichaceae bacterium]|nr:hypothetical protein [Erysipelotrichaceae bacterium]
AVDLFGEVSDEQTIEAPVIFDNASFSISYGGCAKNVAEALLHFGYQPVIISAVGNDILGKGIIDECTNHGIDVANCVHIDGKPTASYLEIKKTPSYSIYMGLSNWAINHELTPEVLMNRRRILANASVIISDDSIPARSIEYLSNTYGRQNLILESTARLSTIKEYLQYFGMIITDESYLDDAYNLNIMEDQNNVDTARKTASELIKHGVDHCLFTFGPQKLCYLHAGKLYYSNVSFRDGKEEIKINQRFGTARAAITSTAVYCLDKGYPIESLLRHVAAARHHIALNGRGIDYSISPNVLVQHLSVLEDNLQIFSISK